MKRILVTGAGGPAAHNFVESLRMAPEKFHIVGADVNPFHLELAPVDKSYRIPPVNDKNYLREVNGIIEKEKINITHPQPDVEVYFLSKNRDKVKSLMFLPSQEAIENSQNKSALIKILRLNKVPTAQSYLLESPNDLDKAFMILKKTNDKLWLRAIRGAGSKASFPFREIGHAKFWIDYWQKMKGVGYGDFMLSEFLPGKDFAFQSLWKGGKLVTSQARERVEYIFGNLTLSGQTSSPSIARTVSRDDINQIATKAIKSLDQSATGIFCVDLKENQDGVPCVTEINAGRFFTTSNFFTQAGCNMPYFYTQLALGEKPPKLKPYNPLPANLYWVRQVDMGYKLLRNVK